MSFLKDESGPTSVEYAVMLALITSVSIQVVLRISSRTNASFSTVGSAMRGSAS